jgi:hypothetical protein
MDIESDCEQGNSRKRVNASIPPGNDRTSGRMFERKTQDETAELWEGGNSKKAWLGETLGERAPPIQEPKPLGNQK